MSGQWLKTEGKRAAVLLPGIVWRAALLGMGLAAGAVLFFVLYFGGGSAELVRIGYVASEEAVTDMLVSYVQEMESVKSYCSLERVEQEEGFALLQSGDLEALMVLPDHLFEEIISGSNAPVTVYFSDEGAAGGNVYGSVERLIFEELADAAVGMLETAQAEIYAVQELSSVDASALETVYDDINAFNLRMLSGRETLFQTKTVSATENDTYVIYYGSALLTLYLLLTGIFLGGFFCHRESWRVLLEKRLGVSKPCQAACSFLAGLLPMAAAELLPLGALALSAALFGRLRELFHVCPDGRVCVLLLLAAAVCVLYFMLIYRMFGEKRGAFAAIGVTAFIQGYLSGCFVPSALLPDLVYGVGKVLPAAYLKQAFTAALSGGAQRFETTAMGLAAWLFVLSAVNLAAVYLYDRRGFARAPWSFAPKRVRIPSAAGVVLRRVLFRKGILATLIFMTAVSVFVTRLETKSDTAFTAAVYDESGAYTELFAAHEGLVRFLPCESAEEVRKMVLCGKAECGYVLPGDLSKRLAKMRANGSVTVYRASDSVCAPLVNEVVFGLLFRQISLEWYTDYMAELCADAGVVREVFAEQIALGKTFGLVFVTLAADGGVRADVGEERTYPLEWIVAAAVFFCGAQGLLLALGDYRRGRYYKKGRGAVFALTVLLPMLAAAVVGAALLITIQTTLTF